MCDICDWVCVYFLGLTVLTPLMTFQRALDSLPSSISSDDTTKDIQSDVVWRNGQ